MVSSLKRPSENDSAEYQQRVRILHEDLPQSARALKRSIVAIPQVHESLKVALDKVIAGDPLSENLLKVLDVSINRPDEVTDPGLGFLVQGANEERQALAKLYRSALESSAHKQTDALVRDRNKAVEDGRKARNPSEGAAHPQIMSEQRNYPMKIGRPYETTGPPISIYHNIFSQFKTLINNPNFDLQPKDVTSAFKLIEAATQFYNNETERLDGMQSLLEALLDRTIGGLPAAYGFRPDGVIFHWISSSGTNAPILVLEANNEIGSGGSDPDAQGAFSLRKIWAHKSMSRLKDRCCCPSFVLSVAGPHITVHGGVLVNSFIVQPLTETLGLANFPDPFGRARYIAQIMVALRTCLKDLEDYYDEISRLAPAEMSQMTCFVPAIRQCGNFTLTYTSGNLLPDRIGRAMFDAKAVQSNELEGRSVKVKFTPRYCYEAHNLLAQKKLAPQILHFGELADGWKVVVMDSLTGPDLASAAQRTVPTRARQDIKEALDLLHEKGLVFGDLRPPNIMLCERDISDGETEQGAMLVDFDWAGKDGEQPYPPSLNTEVNWPDGVEPAGVIRKAHDIAMFESLCMEFAS